MEGERIGAPQMPQMDQKPGTAKELVDPWIHRSKGMKCRTCMWFVAKQTSMIQIVERAIGRCRRHAPSMNGYPVVFANDWCGDHKVDEEKL